MGFIEGQEQIQAARCLNAARKAAGRLAEAPLFWE